MNLPRIVLLVGLCVALVLAFRLEASHPRQGSAGPVVGSAIATRHAQLWLARRNSLEVRAMTGERLAMLDLPDVRQIHALVYHDELDEVWVAADDTLRRFGPIEVAP